VRMGFKTSSNAHGQTFYSYQIFSVSLFICPSTL
jgi:hypothetical protein